MFRLQGFSMEVEAELKPNGNLSMEAIHHLDWATLPIAIGISLIWDN